MLVWPSSTHTHTYTHTHTHQRLMYSPHVCPHIKVMLWKPFTQQQEDGFTALKEFEFTGGETWFIKFGLNASATSVAVGNEQGKIWVWNLATGKCQKLQHPQCRRAIRQIAFGPDGRYGAIRGGAVEGWWRGGGGVGGRA